MKSERLPVRQKCETFSVVEQQIMMYIVLFVIFISIKEVTGQSPVLTVDHLLRWRSPLVMAVRLLI